MRSCVFFLIGFLATGWGMAATLPDNMYFRAMKDEMQRNLKQLRLKGHPNPYYISYRLEHGKRLNIAANMGALVPAVYDPRDKGSITATAFVSVGSDKQDGLGFSDGERSSGLPDNSVWPSYYAIRQGLWQLTDEAYLKAVDLYEKKMAYKQKKNIQDPLPSVMPSTPAQVVQLEEPSVWPDVERLKTEVEQISALGKSLPFVESFDANLYIAQWNIYYLNSRGAFTQHAYWVFRFSIEALFRQTDGKQSNKSTVMWLPDVSVSEMARARQYAQDFLDRIEQAHGAKSGTAYTGPVLLKPKAAARMLDESVLKDLVNTKPLLLAYTDNDKNAGKLYQKRSVRVSTNLLTIYDRPLTRSFEGIPLARFMPVDDEGVAAQNLTLIANGFVQDFPLTQRPLNKQHRSNGHAALSRIYGPREELTNVFVEPKEQWTDAQMEEKLRDHCRELGLEYGYILHDEDPAGDLGIERIYTADGRKETILNLQWDGNFFTQRDLRSVLAVGGKKELVDNYSDVVRIVPSILLEEAELVPQEHKPHRQPFVHRPR